HIVMKFECVKDRFVDVLGKIERITSKNQTLPVLSCVYLEAKENNVVLKSTNLECGLEISVPAKVISPGSLAIPASVLLSFVNSIKDKNITFEAKDGNLSIVTKHHTGTIKSLPHDDFPLIPKIDLKNTIAISITSILKGLKSVWYSASTSTIKPELSSVYVYKSDNDLVFVSTDSFRLAEKKISLKGLKDIKPIIIPVKNVGDIIKTLDGGTEGIHVAFDKNQIAFSSPSTYLVSRIIDATFPDYQQIIPKSFLTEVVVLKQDLIDTLKSLIVFSDKFHQLNIKVEPEKKLLVLQSKNNDVGESLSTLEGAVTGDSVDMNFNQRYVVDCLQSIEGDSVSLLFGGSMKPLVVRGISDPSFTYLVMPMNR
ncbi:MAG TPA: DNA polymerase III subunit beta, partial [Candidatus Paceibacterota bacterium]|nr:DNA polymerase III subunit beta [Candidatus Paceibacterota bacterium]